ncbi:MAG: bifunctional DedA family/phosphatase PAP2 family protein [Candidatus Competibacteraceae bacterium]|jgi:undecaprenyl-diphosphatase|nr:bifunctional DedA family/phosphatase PAP2 family protein [Candidatus Competibacteraceae bacterium]
MTKELYDTLTQWVIAHPGWMGILVFLVALGESLAMVGLLVPGAMLMFGFGALIALGYLDFWTACGWAVAGAVIGDGISFWLGRTFHHRLQDLWPFTRHPEMFERGIDFFQRHGGKSVLLGRFFGPVRPVIPVIAGMLDMPSGRFLLVNIGSALLWAPAYLLPGMVVAFSLELAAQVAWRLVVLILLLIMLLWATIWLVRSVFRFLQPRVHDWLIAFSTWSQDRPVAGPVFKVLLRPAVSSAGELRSLALLAALLLGCATLFSLLLAAAGQDLPTALDRNLYHFLHDLRTPWADDWMVYVTELGDYPVQLALAAAVLLWLYRNRAYSAAWHWLAALGFGLATNTLFKVLFRVERPVDIYHGIASYSFPSNHATSATLLFGFLAVLLARETTPERRWIPYLGAALLVILIAFSRLYLGVHWLTDTLAGVSLGLVWVSLLGLVHNRRPRRPLNRWGLVLISVVSLAVADLFYAGLRHQEDLRFYQPHTTVQTMTWKQWWQGDWQTLPANRSNWQGHSRQAMAFQWADSMARIERRLRNTGWQTPPAASALNAVQWLNPLTQVTDLMVLPRLHQGRAEKLVLVKPGPQPDTRWVLRFWDAGIRLRKENTPLWSGSLTLQKLERRADFLSFTVEIPYSQSPLTLVAAALTGLRQQIGFVPGQPKVITLISRY